MKRSAALLAGTLLASLALAPGAGATMVADCQNKADDDADGLVDRADPGCKGDRDYSERTKPTRREAQLMAESFPFTVSTRWSRIKSSCKSKKAGAVYYCTVTWRESSRLSRAVRVFFKNGTDDAEPPRFYDALHYAPRWYRAACGDLRSRPYPYAIKVRNLPCRSARRYIFNWYARGKRMPSGYRCRLVSTTFGGGKPAYCRKGRRFFSFKFPE